MIFLGHRYAANLYDPDAHGFRPDSASSGLKIFPPPSGNEPEHHRNKLKLSGVAPLFPFRAFRPFLTLSAQPLHPVHVQLAYVADPVAEVKVCGCQRAIIIGEYARVNPCH